MSGTNWMETNILKYYNLEKISLESDRSQFKEKKDKLRAIALGELKREDYLKEDLLYEHEN